MSALTIALLDAPAWQRSDSTPTAAPGELVGRLQAER